eukprot:g10359.t1
MRGEFEVAMRSPGLAALSGCAGTFIAIVTIFRYMLATEDDDSTGAIDGLLLIPMMPTLYTGPYILRGFRLLVMYNPRMRKRWATFAREPVLEKAMVISCVLLEVTSWTAALVLGIERVGGEMFTIYIADTLLTIGACVVLFGKLRKTDDIYSMSTELQKVGAVALLALGVGICYFVLVRTRYAILVWMMVRFHACIWITNIQPLRAMLRRKAENTTREVGFVGLVSSVFPYLPSKSQPSSKVAVDTWSSAGNLRSKQPTSFVSENAGVLHQVMHVPPLLEAFTTFCTKALCSESLMFLLDVEAFSAGLEDAAADSAAGYERCVEIVDKYIREGSPFEVNIEDKTRNEILRATDRKVFMELTLEGKGTLLNKASKEIDKMLADNLYSKFRASAEYKNIEDRLVALEELGG